MSNKQKEKKKEKKNKLKVAPTTTRNDKQRKTNGGKKYFCFFFSLNKYGIIKQVRENQDEVHEVYPIDQVKWLMEHKDILVEM
jgi:hypothetical protein